MSIRNLDESYWPADCSAELIDCSLGELLRQVAAEVPDRVALVDGVPDPRSRRRWTYAEFLHDAERAARALLTSFRPGERIAVYSPNCAEWVILQHGVSLAGLVLVPINPAYGEAELATILRNSGAAGLLYVDHYRGRDIGAMMPGIYKQVPEMREAIPMGQWDPFLKRGNPATLLPDVRSTDLLQIQFTSGTTGLPKGACLHHRGVINTSRFVGERAGFPEGGVWINAMPLFHIAGSIVTELATLNARGTFVVVPGFDPGLMLEIIESERGEATLIVPTMILALLDHPDFSTRDLSSMRTILTGAAVVPAALVHRTKAAFGCELTILFGQTEINGVVTQTRLDDDVMDQSETMGTPLPHAEVCVADPDTGEILPIGATGEICVRGYQNMAGYFGMEEATAETIRQNGWLRTGDLGIMDDRGYLKIAGRLKDMIIRGGMNLYPREIEEVLFNHPKIAQVSVVGVPDERWGEIVAAVILPQDPVSPPAPEDLHDFTRARLSPHKTPVLWYFIDVFPLTPSGKIQKFILQEWIESGAIKAVPWERKSSKLST